MARPPGAATALINLYRGELGRLTTYHQRLDTTTSWAISGLSAAIGLALGGEFSHTIFLIVMLMLIFFLTLEARRFRHYQSSRGRVLLLERGFLTEEIEGTTDWSWTGALVSDLRAQCAPLDQWGAMGWRLRRNYGALYFVTILAWLYKLEVTTALTVDLGAFVTRAGILGIPGPLVLLGVALFYGWLIALAVAAKQRYPEAEDW